MSLALAPELGQDKLVSPTDMIALPPSPLREGEGDERQVADEAEFVDPSMMLEARLLAEAYPESATALGRLAQAALNAGDREEALTAARKALELSTHKRDRGAVAAATQVLRLLGHVDWASSLLEGVSGSGSELASAEISALGGHHQDALAGLEGSGDASSLALRGWLLLKLGKHDRAIHELRRALRIGGASPDLLTNLGYAYAVLGAHKKALIATSAALQLAPRSRPIVFNLVAYLLALGDVDSALRQLRRLQRVHPRDLKIAAAIADVRLGSGDLEGALHELRSAREGMDLATVGSNERAEFLANVAFTEYRLGYRAESDATLIVSRELARTGFTNVSIGNMLSVLLNRQRNGDELRELYQRLSDTHPAEDLYEIRGRLLFLMDDFDAALASAIEWEKVDLLHEGPPINVTYLLCDYKGEFAKAAQHGEGALRRMPASTMLANNVAYAWALARRPDLARRYLPPKGVMSEKAYLVATEALILLAEGDLEGGRQGYDRAVEMAKKSGDPLLPALVRLRAKVAEVQFGLSPGLVTSEAEQELDDPRARLFRQMVRHQAS